YSFTSRVDRVDLAITDGPSKYFFWGSNHNDCSQETSRVVLYEDYSGTPFERTNKPKTKHISHSDYYRCYGFTVTDVPGRNHNGQHIKAVTIGNVHFYSVADLSEVSFTGVLAKASSNYPSWTASNAIGNSAWSNGSPYVVPSSLWFEFPVPIRILIYSFTSRVDRVDLAITDGPSKYFFWGSNHNDCSQETSRVVLYEDNSGTPFERTNKPKTKRISHSDYYRCYGFTVTDVPGRNHNGQDIKAVTIGNVHFYSVA
ncbi:unnamed protein product, partial [Meganyctiphanes norvegica]